MNSEEKKEAGKNGGDRVESLGWLTESALLPRKRQIIDGVSGGTLVDLKAQLYRAQEETNLRKEAGEEPPRKSRKTTAEDVSALGSEKNMGVEERDKKDKLAIKGEADKSAECYAALERKAEIYDQLMCGNGNQSDDDYEVDFFGKKYMQGKSEHTQKNNSNSRMASGHPENSEWEEQEKRREKRELILDEVALTKEGRERASRVKHRREVQAQAKRDRLKNAFLKKQIEKLKKSKTKGKGEGKEQ